MVPDSGYKTVIVQIEPPIATLTLNRPGKLNAFSRQLQLEVLTALDSIENDDRIRSLILMGAGRAFSAGFDLESGSDDDRTIAEWKDDKLSWRFVTRVWDFPKPVIAATQGYCIGGACDLALLCDITIASDDCRFGEPEIRLGSGSTSAAILAAALPLKVAKELLYSGHLIDAQRAYEIGMVNEVVPTASLERRARHHAMILARVSPFALRLIKESVNQAFEIMGLRAMMAYNLNQVAIINGTVTDEYLEFRRIRDSQGLKEALALRHQQFSELEDNA